MPRKKSEKHITHAPAINKTEDRQIDLIDQLIEFEEFQQLLPTLKKAVQQGKGARDIIEDMAPYAAARLVNIVATEKDPGKALAAAKDLLDRALGKATEKKEIKHKFADMSEEELNAILESQLQDIEDVEFDEED